MNVMQVISKRSMWLTGCAAICAVGCGGGQSGPSSANAAMHTTHSGDAVVTYFGQPKPQLTTSAGSVTVVGQAGASFSTVTLEPAPNLDNTYLAIGRFFGEDGPQAAIYTLSYPQGASQLLYQDSSLTVTPAISAYGTIAFFDQTINNLRSIRDDGTGLTSLVFGAVTGATYPRYSTDGTNRLIFNSGPDLYVAPGTGGTPTLVQSNDSWINYGGQSWNPAGTKIIYPAPVGTSGNVDLFTTPVGGGAATDVTPLALKNSGSIIAPSWSQDGVSIAAMYGPDGGSGWQILRFNINDPADYEVVTPSGDSELFPVFSPDGSKMAVYRTSINGQTPGVYVEDALGINTTLLAADPSDDPDSGSGGMSWSPFLPKETVVAASGSTFYHQAASGFLLTQNGDQFGSLVAFTANTPADAAIQAPSTISGNAPLAFTLTADSITSIGYINNYFSPGTTITLTTTPSVVVTVDAGTGHVDTVAPSATAKPTAVQNADGTLTYKASFKAVYDGRGKNLAPNGASALTVDPKTGKLVTFK